MANGVREPLRGLTTPFVCLESVYFAVDSPRLKRVVQPITVLFLAIDICVEPCRTETEETS